MNTRPSLHSTHEPAGSDLSAAVGDVARTIDVHHSVSTDDSQRAGAMTDRVLCGWRVRSSLPLPETLPWYGPDRPVDIEVCRGPVPMPRHHSGNTTAPPYIQAAHDGCLILNAMPIARYLVCSDRVLVDTLLEEEALEWRVLLLGPVLGLLCYLRGLLPLHASAVRIGNKVVALAGRSGIGKSTLAAALSQRGHFIIAEDVCPIDVADQLPVVLPTFRALKLHAATLTMLGFGTQGLPRLQFGAKKYHLLLNRPFDPTPLTLDIVYLVEDALPGLDDNFLPVTGAKAFERLSAKIYRPEFGQLLLTKPALFGKVARLAERVAVRRLIRTRDATRLTVLIESIEADAVKELS